MVTLTPIFSFLYNAKFRKSGLSARIALSVGFEGMYMTGAGTNASVSLIAP
jgi:2-methylisocitrate lyase-like PEP mutase family enzyme